MRNPFTARVPWAAAFLTFVFSPFVSMLYLNRGALAALYLFGTFALAAAVLILLGPRDIAPARDLVSLVGLGVTLVGMIHAIVLAWRWDRSVPLKPYARWYGVLGIATLLVALVLCLRAFVFQPFSSSSASMSPAVNPGDYFFVSRLSYDFAPPRRGDVVVVSVPRLGDAVYIKRIVGLPGDRVQLRGGQLYLNGVAMRRRRVEDFSEPCGAPAPCHVPQYEESLPGGRTDRVLERVAHGELDDTPVYLVAADSYFVIGDNRDDSDDSRTGFGFIPRAKILGRAAVRFAVRGQLVWKAIR